MTHYKKILFIGFYLTVASQLFAIEEHFPDILQDYSPNIHKYCIEEGDTLAEIAIRHKVSVSFLLYLNAKTIKQANKIYTGQVIKVPGKKIIDLVESQSRRLLPLVAQLGASKYQKRKEAIDNLVQKDWRAVTVLLQALKHKDVEIRENAREALMLIHQVSECPVKLKL